MTATQMVSFNRRKRVTATHLQIKDLSWFIHVTSHRPNTANVLGPSSRSMIFDLQNYSKLENKFWIHFRVRGTLYQTQVTGLTKKKQCELQTKWMVRKSGWGQVGGIQRKRDETSNTRDRIRTAEMTRPPRNIKNALATVI